MTLNSSKKKIESASRKLTNWVGSSTSVIVHTVFFAGIFILAIFGVPIDKVLLILTTAVSLEAIYLSIFIQMTVNKNTESLEEVEEDIDEIQKDVDEIQEDVGEVQKDIDEIQEDVDEVQKDIDEIQEEDVDDDKHDMLTKDSLNKIEAELQKLVRDIEALKHQKK
jgi:low affinity Fe/Cu permease